MSPISYQPAPQCLLHFIAYKKLHRKEEKKKTVDAWRLAIKIETVMNTLVLLLILDEPDSHTSTEIVNAENIPPQVLVERFLEFELQKKNSHFLIRFDIFYPLIDKVMATNTLDGLVEFNVGNV